MSSVEDSGSKSSQDDKVSKSNPIPKRDVGRELKSITNRLLRREKGSTQSKFAGDGVVFKAKLIGVEEIDEARGDKLCQETLQRLKQVVKTSGTHKQRISLSVSLSGVKLLEEKTGVLLYHHPVHQISFISQDISDDRAFGYICSPSTSIFHFVAIKTEKSASLIVLTLRDLFQVVLDIKKKHKLKQQQAKEDLENEFSKETSSVSSTQSKSDTSYEKQQPVEECEEALYAEVGQFAPLGAEQEAKAAQANSTVNEDVLKTANDLLCGDLLDLNFEETQPITVEAIFLDKPMEPAEPKGIKEEIVIESITSDSFKNEIDRYAVFEEIDRVTTSIFENPVHISQLNKSFDQSASPPPSSPSKVKFENDFTNSNIKFEHDFSSNSPSKVKFEHDFTSNSPMKVKFESNFASNESLQMNHSFETDFDTSFSSSAAPPSVFADLDPLAKDRPFTDKKVFFNEIKNPPRKNLKDLMTRNNTVEGCVNFQSSPPTTGVSIFSMTQDSVIPPPNYPPPLCAIPPFVSDNVCSSPPRVPPRVPFDVFSQENQIQTKFNPFSSSSDIELPPPNTPPPVLESSDATEKNVFVNNIPVLPKINTIKVSDGSVYQAPIASPPIAITNSKKTQMLRSGSLASNSSIEDGAYSSSWSVTSKCNNLGSDKFFSNDEIAPSSESQTQSPSVLRKKVQRSNWNTFEIDDFKPVSMPISEPNDKIKDVFDKSDDFDKLEAPPPQLTSNNSAVQSKMPTKDAPSSFGSQIFGTSSAINVTNVEEVSSPEELSIFKRKQDPFADDFFLSLAK